MDKFYVFHRKKPTIEELNDKVTINHEGTLNKEKFKELVSALFEMTNKGITDRDSQVCKMGFDFLRLKEKEIREKRRQNQVKITTEQMSRLKHHRLAYSLLASNNPIPENLFLGLFSHSDSENISQSNKFLYKINKDQTLENTNNDLAWIPTPEFLETMNAEAEKRELEINNRVEKRIQELEQLPSNLSNDPLNVGELSEDISGPKIKKIIELKSLKLRQEQQKIRKKVIQYSQYFFNPRKERKFNLKQYERPILKRIKTAADYEREEMRRKEARTREEKEKRMKRCNEVISQAFHLQLMAETKQVKRYKLGRSIIAYHAHLQRQAQKEMERSARERINALKNNDEEAYMKLVDEHKDERITHLLRQTDRFLETLTEAVLEHQRDHMKNNKTNNVNSDDTETETVADGEDGKKIDYLAIAHKVQEEVEQPNILLGGILKDYQIQGLKWMVSLFNNRLNGILADEMGLGKTIQTISLITYLVERKNERGPYLIIVPLSTMTNWVLEFEKWAPSIKICTYKGTPPTRKLLQKKYLKNPECQVFLTTYEYIIKDKAVLSKQKWLYCIIDEGHRMKNNNSRLSIVLSNDYALKYRLILTGTPLQNNLPELWALLNFILPKIFNSVNSFEEWFNTPFANTGGQDKIELNEEETLLIIRRLHKVLRPFLLRRLKKDVESQLPDKVERIIKVKSSALQQKLYSQMITHGAIFVGSGERGKTGIKSHRNTVMQLRKICNHPFVFKEVEQDINPTNDDQLLVRVSGKFDFLDRVLPKYFATKHRVLLFCQMTNILTIMEDFLNWRGYKYLRLDGSIKSDDRTTLLKSFNSPDSQYFIFLLSTRAGGLGLNLQSADTVILYDSDWNPHQDLQAQDRAHRVGQTKEVQVLRLITQNSVEEKVLAKAQFKLDMDGKVIQAGKFDQTTTDKAREEFLRSLLEGDNTDVGGDEREDLDDDEINEIIARSEDELILFRKMDEERIRAEEAKWKVKGLPVPERLITESELPQVYLREFRPILDDGVEYGRGQRQRKEVIYDDGLTEDQFLAAVENNVDLENLIAKKQKANRRRQEKKKLKQDVVEESSSTRSIGDSQSIDDSAEESSSPTQTPRPKRSRKTINYAIPMDIPEVDTETVSLSKRKKGKGEEKNVSIKVKKEKESTKDNVPNDELDDEPEDGPENRSKRKRKSKDQDVEEVKAETSKKTEEKTRPNRKVKNKKKESTIITLSLNNDRINKRDEITEDMEVEAAPRPKRYKTKSVEKKSAALHNHILECLSHITNLRVKGRRGQYRYRAELFYELPSKQVYPYYYDQIKKPISINIIRQKIEDHLYNSAEEFKRDMELMFANAKSFNLEGSDVYKDSEIMQKSFNIKYEALFNKDYVSNVG
ncbi:4583_t:CDS:2 [Diversispora eburnea]|uniref:4583_t:CDS:1 n=1 Tax=Diversispora eburnea TaxID=1213867 RepID=A0A9N8ZS57_9GLOM|nr:4583_t:CDS:2 [Diversispora eburnea]